MVNKESNKKYKSIVISDVHLGSQWSCAKEATQFINENSCENLFLLGDIIDGWVIMRSSKVRWQRKHSSFIKAILDVAVDSKIIYIKGNHDDFLDRLIPINFGNISIVQDYTYKSGDKKYFLIHGDIFDKVTSSMRWLSKLGDLGYHALLWINKLCNRRKIRKGIPYISFAQRVKHKVKKRVNEASNFEENIADLAKSKGCDGVICGHIHHPEMKMIHGVEYLNSGDWVESLTALVEDFDGNWSIVKSDKLKEE